MRHRKPLCTLLCVFCVLFSFLPVYSEGSYKDIRVGVSGEMQPLLYISGNGVPTGMYVDIMKELARIGGMNIEYVVFDRQNQAVDALSKGNIDAVLGVHESDFASYPALCASAEIYSAPICLVTRKEFAGQDIDILSSEVSVAAYELGTVGYSQVVQQNAKLVKIVSTQEQLFHVLNSGEADLIMAVRDCIEYMMEGKSDQYEIVFNYMSSVGYSILTRRADHLRFDLINESINRLRSSSDYDDIIKRWIVDRDLENAQDRIRNLTMGFGVIFGLALFSVVVIFFFNRRLRTLVDEKTQELKDKVDDLENAYTLRNKLLEHSNSANLVVRQDGTVLLMNDVARRMEDIPIEKVDLPNIESMHIIGQAWKHAPTEMDQPALLVIRDDDGHKRTYRYQRHQTSVQEERVFILEDVTGEEKERQDIFEESKNKALNRIIAGIAHEIKNPLTTIRNYASLATEQADDPEFMESFQKYIPKEVDRISEMIATLMNYSRPPKGQKESFAVAELVDDCIGLAYISSKNKIGIQTKLDRTLFLYANKEQLRQALVNLLLNSIESVLIKMKFNGYMGEQGKQAVHISVYQKDSEIILEVYDNGMGMSDEQVQQCTDPFFTTKKTGTGMGLAMSKMYLRENGGRLEVESKEGVYTLMRMVFKEDNKHNET